MKRKREKITGRELASLIVCAIPNDLQALLNIRELLYRNLPEDKKLLSHLDKLTKIKDKTGSNIFDFVVNVIKALHSDDIIEAHDIISHYYRHVLKATMRQVIEKYNYDRRKPCK